MTLLAPLNLNGSTTDFKVVEKAIEIARIKNDKVVFLQINDEFSSCKLAKEPLENQIKQKCAGKEISFKVKVIVTPVPEMAIVNEINKGGYTDVILTTSHSELEKFFRKIFKFNMEDLLQEKTKKINIVST